MPWATKRRAKYAEMCVMSPSTITNTGFVGDNLPAKRIRL
jgi:hypothetical protein